ncbi:MAG: hypothetical protein U1E10_01580, partial [Bdellovibrionales bacterium]|nr:hypothetical protein [Bdellovibrionales bacterium]
MKNRTRPRQPSRFKVIFATSVRLFLLVPFFAQSFAGYSSYAATYDSSGREGSDGSRETWHGRSATASSPGEDGRDISLSLTDLDRGGKAIMQIVGTVGNRGVQDGVEISPNVSLHLRANGGRGGNGGRGADGRDGSDGSSGSSASQYSHATNGGAGEDGGDGGDGTRGSNGGNGGKITVKLAAEDLHLSMLVGFEVEGGKGGDPGYNGRAGEGGDGGRGGSGASWTEKTGTQTCAADRFVDNGNGSSSVVKGDCTDDTRSVSRPGASNGPDGSDGRAGRGNISGGTSGGRGSYQFVVSGPGGTTIYKNAIDLRLSSFSFRESNANGIFEPGEVIEVTDLVVQNQSDMPWVPGKAKALLSLGSGNWITAEPIEIEIPAVNGRTSTTLGKTFRFRIRDTQLPVSENRLSLSESIVPFGRITRIERTPRGLQLPKTLVISYPVEITPLQTKRNAVSPGEIIDVSWSVKNLSRSPIGLNSAEARALSTSIRQWRPPGEDLPGGISFDGTSLASTFARTVALLAPGASFVVKGKLKFDDNHLPYTTIDVQTGATLKTLGPNGSDKEIQLRSYRFSIAQTFGGHKDANWLIVTNSGTKREEYLSWLGLAKKLGMKVDVWDLAFQGPIQLFQNLKSGSAIAELYRNKTIIVLNNLYRNNEVAALPYEQFNSDEVLKTLSENGIRFYFVGGSQTEGDRHLYSLLGKTSSKDATTVLHKDFLAQLKAGKAPPAARGSKTIVPVEVEAFLKPSPREFAKHAQEVRDALEKVAPGEKYSLELISSGVVEKNSDVYRKYLLGTIVLTATGSRGSSGTVTWLPRDLHEQQSSEFVMGEENIKALTLASSVTAKLQFLKNLGSSNPSLSDTAISAIVLDLVEELDQPTPNLKFSQAFITETAAERDPMIKQNWFSILAGRLQFYSEYAADTNLNWALDPLLKVLSVGTPSFEEKSKAEFKRLEKVMKDRRGILIADSKKRAARRMLFLPVVSRATQSN